MPTELNPQKILEFLKANTNIVPKYCDNCGAQHQLENVQIIGTRDNMVSCRIHCKQCKSTHLLNVSAPINGVGVASRAPMNVDLRTEAEFKKFAGKSAVNGDDAIAAYKSLTNVRSVGDFLQAVGN